MQEHPFAAFTLALKVQAESGPKLVDWKKCLAQPKFQEEVSVLRKEVEQFAEKFPLPGVEGL